MNDLSIPKMLRKKLNDFVARLKEIYPGDIASLILYGSAASGEFVDKHSNLNLLVVLKDTSISALNKSADLVNKFNMVTPLFLTESYITSSLDIFPIEFLDMQENYVLLYGKDVLKEVNIDTKNLRFQCEQELKIKLINLRQSYLRVYKNKTALRNLLIKSFTSVLHISRNILRLKAKKPAYKKENIIKELEAEFKIDLNVWKKILTVRSQGIKLSNDGIEQLFIDFVGELEKIVAIVDKL